MTSSAEQIRAWRGPALLSYGFRPFFLGAAIWAVLATTIWMTALATDGPPPSRFAPAVWHAHEFLFGYLSAVIAGFLLTAVPNWTGRLPIVGWRLGWLFGLWVIGRVAIGISGFLPVWLVALAALAMPVALAFALAREIIAGRNWRNLIVLGALGMFICGNALFLLEDAIGHHAARGYGLRLGLGGAIMLTAIIGGRIVPSFTRNWLARQGPGRLPVPPMKRFDWWSLGILGLALLAWLVAPQSVVAGWGLVLAGLVHLWRLTRWAGERSLGEPLLWVLHLGYAMLPLGALLIGVQILCPDVIEAAAARHMWLAGVIGIMTLAVMTRATLGHSGQRLTAGPGTVTVYLAAFASVLARVLAGVWVGQADLLYMVSGGLWITAFAGFVLIYGPLLIRPRRRG